PSYHEIRHTARIWERRNTTADEIVEQARRYSRALIRLAVLSRRTERPVTSPVSVAEAIWLPALAPTNQGLVVPVVAEEPCTVAGSSPAMGSSAVKPHSRAPNNPLDKYPVEMTHCLAD